MVFGSVFEVLFRASAVFLCFRDRKHSVIGGTWRSIIPYNNSWVYASAFLSMLKSRNISLPITYFSILLRKQLFHIFHIRE